MLNAIYAFLAIGFMLFHCDGNLSKVEIPACRFSFEATFYSINFYIDPTFLVYDDIETSGLTFANVVLIDNEFKDNDTYRAYILRHEMNHVKQNYALGIWRPIAILFISNIEPDYESNPIDITRPEQNDELMWLPKETRKSWWHFLTIGIHLG